VLVRIQIYLIFLEFPRIDGGPLGFIVGKKTKWQIAIKKKKKMAN
jgi:hypothetical protein